MMKYIFTENEFITFLAIGNVMSIYSAGLADELDDKSIVEAVHSLYKHGFITERNGTLFPAEKMSDFIEAVNNSGQAFKLKVPGINMPIRVIYKMNFSKIVVLERFLSKAENTVRLQMIETDYFIQELLENELPQLLPSFYLKDSFEKGELLKFEEAAFEQVIFSLECVDLLTKEEVTLLQLQSDGLSYSLKLKEEDGINKQFFSTELFKNFLYRELGGKNCDKR